ncbi:unnamed protein product [Rotaria magnacalcarata]|nr:unnamed protein product [Rotaria magnacalcarata]
MGVFNSMIVIALVLSIYVDNVHTQGVCSAAAAQICAPYTCVQTDAQYSCVCSNLQITQSAAECTNIGPVVPPNQCGNAVCPAGATCVPTNQNPSQYVCICPNNVIGNPNCPVGPPQPNPCLYNNPCRNFGTCVVNPLTQQPVCICPPNNYGSNCLQSCPRTCEAGWCYNGGRCNNLYGQAYCSCPQNYRGRRCELRYSQYNYVYLYHYPYYGK